MAPARESAPPPAPRLSVVLACPGRAGATVGALRALERGTAGVPSEVLVVTPSDAADEPTDPAAEAVRGVKAPPDSLVPELWAAGLRVARGETVAFTTTHFRVTEGWAAALLAALDGGAVGAGGPVRLAAGAGALERAVHLLRYSAHAGPRPPGTVDEIPGDNAAYRRSVLEREGDLLTEGFWEVEVHRRLRARDESLAWAPAAEVLMVSSDGLGAFLRQRYRHGRRFGRYRTRELGVPAWRSLVAAPLVPAVLSARALARGRPGERVRSLSALPYLLLTASAWSAGEARGAWRALRGREEEGRR